MLLRPGPQAVSRGKRASLRRLQSKEEEPSIFDSPRKQTSTHGKHLRDVVQGGLPAVERAVAVEAWGHPGSMSHEPSGMELDSESGDELDELAVEVCQSVAVRGAGRRPANRWQRFALLKQLWRGV